jgi:hypothetical protein
MTNNADQRAFAETVFDRKQRCDAEINEALKQENARREAALRLQRDQNGQTR